MNAPLRLGLGHALHTVAARLELELRVGPLPDDARDDLLVAAELRGALRDDLDLPALALGIAGVHPEQVAREQRRFVAPGAGADLEEDIALVIRVLRQQRLVQLGLELFHARARALQLVVGECLHRGVGGHFLRRVGVALRLPPALVKRDDPAQLGVLARQLAELLEVLGSVLGGEQPAEVLEAPGEAVELRAQRRFHVMRSTGFTSYAAGATALRRARDAPRPRSH